MESDRRNTVMKSVSYIYIGITCSHGVILHVVHVLKSFFLVFE